MCRNKLWRDALEVRLVVLSDPRDKWPTSRVPTFLLTATFTQQSSCAAGAPPKMKKRSDHVALAEWRQGKKAHILQAEPDQVTQVEYRSSAASLNNNLTGDTFRYHQMSLSPGEARRGCSLFLVSHPARFIEKNADSSGGTYASHLSTLLRD